VICFVLIASVARAHVGPADANGGHECTQADADAGTCAPAGSYHCHTQTCTVPAGKQLSTSGLPTSLEEALAQIGQSPGPSAVASTTATTAPVATSAPLATPLPTMRALSNTGTFTEVLGWTGAAILFLGFALVLMVPARRRARTGD
jgi:hypothetical protein